MGVRHADGAISGRSLCTRVYPVRHHCLSETPPSKFQIKEFQLVTAAEPGAAVHCLSARCDLSARLFVPPSFVSSRPLLCVSSADPLCTGGRRGVGAWGGWGGSRQRLKHKKKKKLIDASGACSRCNTFNPPRVNLIAL